MKICYLSPSYDNPHIKNWVDEFRSRNYDVTIVSPVGGTVSKIIQAKRLVDHAKPDVLHAHYVSGYGVFGAFTRYHPFVISCWGSDIRTDPKSFIKRQFIRYALKHADVVHVQDVLMKERVREIYSHKDILVQAWGVNLDVFKPIKHKNDIPTLICTRSTKSLYDVDTLLTAIPLVQKKVDVKFVFTSIKAPFPFDDYIKLLQNSDFYVDTFYPFDGRGGQAYGQALLEAMACGVPTLVADRPTLHISPDWYFGDTFKDGDSIDLANKLIELINDGNRQKDIIRKNRSSVMANFNWKKNMDVIDGELYGR